METSAPTRLHALDNLRALMMWLGIVLHVLVIYMAGQSILPWHDDQRTVVADISMAFIHAFRMPVFFIVAGFFAIMLVQTRGPKGMAEHRLLRLGVPFAVMWLPVIGASATFASIFAYRMFNGGDWGADIMLVKPPPGVPRTPTTMHMWFLWMLLWMCLATAALAQFDALKPWFLGAAGFLRTLGERWWGFLVLAIPNQAAGWPYPNGLLFPSGLLLPPFSEWLHNGVFFVFGAAVYVHREALFARYSRLWWVYFALGCVPFVATGSLMEHHGRPDLIAYTYGCTSWLWSFAMIGLALRVLSTRNTLLAYLARSSYWVYLVHLPLTILFGLLMYRTALPVGAKILINILGTTVVCLISYEYFVRSTWVGEMLNGQRDPPRAQAVPPAEPAT